MPIDPTGTKPGLKPQAQEPEKHNMKCKNKGCDSMQVYELQIPGNVGRHVYRCVECNTTWTVTTGGGVDLG
jgi:transposase-like protein